EGEVALNESVGRELALAINSARLLDKKRQRLLEQAALLRAAEAVSSELELEAVLQRLVDEVAHPLVREAACCYLIDPDPRTLRCWRPSQRSQRSRSALPRASGSARGRQGSSKPSTTSRLCSRCRSPRPRRCARLLAPLPRRSAAARRGC